MFAEDLDAAGQVRLAFGLLDLLNEYWVTCEIRVANEDAKSPLPADVLWDGYRRRLEADQDTEAITYSLWVDRFEDHFTSAPPSPRFSVATSTDGGRAIGSPGVTPRPVTARGYRPVASS